MRFKVSGPGVSVNGTITGRFPSGGLPARYPHNRKYRGRDPKTKRFISRAAHEAKQASIEEWRRTPSPHPPSKKLGPFGSISATQGYTFPDVKEYAKDKEKFRERVILGMLPTVYGQAKVCALYLNRWWTLIDIDDLVSEGCVAAVEAVDNLNPIKHTSWATMVAYTRLRVFGRMVDALRKWAWVPRTIINKLKKELYEDQESMDYWETYNFSLMKSKPIEWFDHWPADIKAPIEELMDKETTDKIFEQVAGIVEVEDGRYILSYKERAILYWTCGFGSWVHNPMNGRGLAKYFGVTPGRISQIKSKALDKLSEELERDGYVR